MEGNMADEFRKITRKVVYGGREFECVYRETRRPDYLMDKLMGEVDEENSIEIGGRTLEGAHGGFCSPFHPRTYIAEPGIICEQDVLVELRDGAKIYTDIYRPDCNEKVPCLVSWSYFGKRPGDGMDEWQIIGVPPGTVSKMTKFESPDPGFWCRNGYAVANVDPRGVGHSEGDICMFGTQDAQDGYDFIEWAAVQHWCNGKVGMAGNSGVAMPQWRIAAQQPPHLFCIAPWEGTTDVYRESLRDGGIPAIGFNDFIIASLVGLGYVDDMSAMAEKYPFVNEYWMDKYPDWSKIRIPAYITICWQHFHLRGTCEGWRRIRSTKKWLRAHREFEWPDTYNSTNIQDLKRFFDRYLKDIRNGWELTPKVRLEVMDAYDYDIQKDRTEKAFPIKRTEYRRLYLDASNGSMSFEQVPWESSVSYDATGGETTFDITFTEDVELIGYPMLHAWVECEGHDEMDLFVNVQKLDDQGNFLPTLVLGEPHPGSWGRGRVSRRELDEKLSTKYQPVMAHRREKKLGEGEIVPFDLEIVPICRFWHKGQKLRLQIAGRYIREGWFEPFFWDTDNRGKHIIHTGGKYDSYLQIPVIPPRYVVGDYVYR
jgi:predicted acyl esterase